MPSDHSAAKSVQGIKCIVLETCVSTLVLECKNSFLFPALLPSLPSGKGSLSTDHFAVQHRRKILSKTECNKGAQKEVRNSLLGSDHTHFQGKTDLVWTLLKKLAFCQ